MTDSSVEVLHKTLLALRQTRQELKDLRDSRSESIAIIGTGCRLPGSVNNLAEFESFLREGQIAVTDLPDSRWDVERYFDPNPDNAGTMHVRKAAVLDDISGFDAAFFGISPREATVMDPQQRILMEVVWEALENAGIPPSRLKGSRTGVFVGLCANDYASTATDPEAISIYNATAAASSVAAGRISYFYDFRGPSLVVDTAGSSSLVAVHLAIQSLRADECDYAVVAGVSAIATPRHMIEMSKLKALSPSARCTPFGDDADGYTRGEGCGVVILRRSVDADPRHTIAKIVASAVTQDGTSNGLTAPNGGAQEQVLRDALTRAGLCSSDINYLEAHGTGTPLGDPIEMAAINNVLGIDRDNPLTVGSVKANIGHLEAAAGAAGLLKAVAVVKSRVVPPTPGIGELNTFIDWPATNVNITRALQPLPDKGKLHAGVSSFGFSGTNAHIIVSSPDDDDSTPVRDTPRWLVLLLSTKTPESLAGLARRYRELIAESDERHCHDICFSAATERASLEHRAVLIAQSRAALDRGLAALSDGRQRAGVHAGRRAHTSGGTVFVFAGHGGQWAGMARQLISHSDTFRRTIEQCSDAMTDLVDVNIAEALAKGSDFAGRIDVEIPMSFAVQIGIASVLTAHGIHPDSVVGHSMGEIAAAYCCGALDMEEAAQVICERSRILQRLSGTGALLAIPSDAESTRQMISDHGYDVDIAAVNGPSRTVVTGDPLGLAQMEADLLAQGLEAHRVRVQSAAHSRHLDPHLPEFRARIGDVQPNKETAALFSSSVVGGLIDPTTLDSDYWVRNLREPVLFESAFNVLLDRGADTIIEIGPSPVLLDTIIELAETEPNRPRLIASAFRRNGDPVRDLLELFGRLHVHGAPVDVAAFGLNGEPVPLPTYPWEHKHLWQQSDWDRTETGAGAATTSATTGDLVHESTIDMDRHGWLLDHAVEHLPVVPGAWQLNHAAAIWHHHGHQLPCAFDHFVFERPLVLQPGTRRRVQVVYGTGKVHIAAAEEGASNWVPHATGHIAELQDEKRYSADLLAISERCASVDIDKFYASCASRGLNYGGSFRTITELRRGVSEALASVELVNHASRTRLDLMPSAMLDGCFQAIGALADANDGLCLPKSIERMVIWAPFTAQVCVHVRNYTFDGLRQQADLDIYDPTGELLATVAEFTAERIDRQSGPDASNADILTIEFDHQELHDTATHVGMVLFTGPNSGVDHPALVNVSHLDSQTSAISELTPALLESVSAIVFTAGAPSEDVTPSSAFDDLHAILAVVQLLVGLNTPPRLYIVTVNAQAVCGEPVNPLHSMLWGFGTALAAEHPELRTTLVDRATAHDYNAIAAELSADHQERHIVWRGNERYVARLRPADIHQGRRKPAVDPQAFRLSIDAPGQLESLVLREIACPTPRADEVVIRVHAAAMNFADVMRAMGFFIEPHAERTELGSECAGTVSAVGSDIGDIRIGDKVVGVSLGCFATHVAIPRKFIVTQPRQMSDETAASAPVAYTTASYALERLARLRSGDHILIHSASGGTGLAAIAIARSIGLEISATAGTPAKRELLREMGIKHVLDSRTTSYADDILRITDGRGVDCILNSLSGPAMEANLRALAVDGTLLELGKRDIYSDNQLPLHHFKKRIAFHAVDMAGLQVDRPEVFAALLADVMKRLANAELPALPVTAHPMGEAGAVFRTMSTGDHTGKLVLTVDQPGDFDVIADPVARLAGSGCYVVSGGLGGIGVELASWLARQGAQEIALIARSEPNSKALEAIARLRDSGVRIHPLRADVADKEQLRISLDNIRAAGSAIRGVFHLAGILNDGLIATQDWNSFREVLPPKVLGASNLHELTIDDPVEIFVMYSSAASLLPSGGQANYAAANAFLDGLAHHRRAHNLPATTVSWGPFSDVGMAANSATEAHLGKRGIAAITSSASHDVLARAFAAEQTHSAALLLDPSRWLAAHAYARAVPLYSGLGDGESTGGNVDFSELPIAERGPAVRRVVLEQISTALGLDIDEIPSNVAFVDLGIGSLAVVELRNALSTRLAIAIPSGVQWKYPTIDALQEFLLDRLAAEPVTDPVSASEQATVQ